MDHKLKRYRCSTSTALSIWGELPRLARSSLRQLVETHGFSLLFGDLYYIAGRWYVSHSGLLRLARRNRCVGIRVQPVVAFCDAQANRWTFKATVYTSSNCKGFVGYGDAEPSNVSPLVRGAEMRVAETRAVNRALRKAYGIGLCSFEELGSRSSPPAKPPAKVAIAAPAHQPASGNGNGRPLLRDRLCQLIRQYRLDPEQVKRYAADFCGTQVLREASRELVEDFVNLLAEWAARDRQGLLCHLNRYATGSKSVDVEVKKEAAS